MRRCHYTQPGRAPGSCMTLASVAGCVTLEKEKGARRRVAQTGRRCLLRRWPEDYVWMQRCVSTRLKDHSGYSRYPEGGGIRLAAILPLRERRGASRLKPAAVKRIIVDGAWDGRQLPCVPFPPGRFKIWFTPARRKPPLVGHGSRRLVVGKVRHGPSFRFHAHAHSRYVLLAGASKMVSKTVSCVDGAFAHCSIILAPWKQLRKKA